MRWPLFLNPLSSSWHRMVRVVMSCCSRDEAGFCHHCLASAWRWLHPSAFCGTVNASITRHLSSLDVLQCPSWTLHPFHAKPMGNKVSRNAEVVFYRVMILLVARKDQEACRQQKRCVKRSLKILFGMGRATWNTTEEAGLAGIS